VTRKERVVGACLATLALCLTACSSGGRQHSSTTTTSRSASTTAARQRSRVIAATTTPASTPHVVANLGPCPKLFPFGPASGLNTGVSGLDKKLVPIAALSVRLCRYDLVEVNVHTSTFPLAGSGILTGAPATQLEGLANHLPTAQTRGCGSGQLFLLTFASETQHVDVEEGTNAKDPTGCGPVNGKWGGGQSTGQWLNELGVNTRALHQ
jgi:hypothetical protein